MNTSPTLQLPEDTDARTDPRPRIQLSANQVIASALAAITATVAASFLGIAGTVIGAAVASVLSVTGNAVYSHSIQRTGDRVIATVRTAVPSTTRIVQGPRAGSTGPARRARQTHRTWPLVAAACAGVFAGVLLVVTTVELAAGRPLSDVVRGKQGSGTSLLGNNHDTARSTPVTPSQQVTVTVTPTVVTSTPTVTVTGTPVTTTSTPTSTTTPTPTTPARSSTSPGSVSATPTG